MVGKKRSQIKIIIEGLEYRHLHRWSMDVNISLACEQLHTDTAWKNQNKTTKECCYYEKDKKHDQIIHNYFLINILIDISFV